MTGMLSRGARAPRRRALAAVGGLLLGGALAVPAASAAPAAALPAAAQPDVATTLPHFQPLPRPVRLMDTRPGESTADGQDAGIGVRARNQDTPLRVAGRAGVSADATSVVLSLTVTQPGDRGFVTVYPCGAPVPTASNINFVAGQTVAVSVVAGVGDGGQVCLLTSAPTHLVVDASGYFLASSRLATLPAPARVMDTRPGAKTVDGQDSGAGMTTWGQVVELTVAGRAGVPAGATAVLLSVTVTQPQAVGFVTVFPCGQAVPNASNLNHGWMQTVANAVVSRVGTDGRVCLRTAVPTHLVVDVSSYVTDDSVLAPLATPARLVDTRPGEGTVDGVAAGDGMRGRGQDSGFPVAGRGGLPADTQAVVLNVTATGGLGDGYVTVRPCDRARPLASQLNYSGGQTVANQVITRVGNDGRVCFFTSAPVHLVVDVAAAWNTNTHRWAQVSDGDFHACAVDGFGQAYCWGYGGGGRLGNGTTTDGTDWPVPVSVTGALAGKTLTAVAAGGDHTCALDSTGRAYCWGKGTLGQLGTGAAADSAVPVAVDAGGALAGKTLTALSSGESHTCALDTAGKAYCWGRGDFGQLGAGAAAGSPTPVAVATGGALAGKVLTGIAAGYLHTCAVDSAGAAYCWGRDFYGQLGNGLTGDASSAASPVAVVADGALAGVAVTSVSARGNHTCAVGATGGAYCWGRNEYGQLGNGVSGLDARSGVPVAVKTTGVLAGRTLRAVAAGGEHTCALDTAGRAYCWGRGDRGQLGDGAQALSADPVAVSAAGVLAGRSLSGLTSGWMFSSAVDTGQTAYAWGDGVFGQLGYGLPLASTPVPVRVSAGVD